MCMLLGNQADINCLVHNQRSGQLSWAERALPKFKKTSVDKQALSISSIILLVAFIHITRTVHPSTHCPRFFLPDINRSMIIFEILARFSVVINLLTAEFSFYRSRVFLWVLLCEESTFFYMYNNLHYRMRVRRNLDSFC